MIKSFGIVLIVLGLIGLAWGGLSYTKTEKAVDLGPVQINTQTRKNIPIPPLAGAAALIGGIALIATAKSS